MYQVMIVDDDANVLKALRRVLSVPLAGLSNGGELDITTLQSPQAALERAGHTPFALVISDYRMPVMDGITLLRQVATVQPDTMRIITSAAVDLDALAAAINECQVFRYIPKPWNDTDLRASVFQALRHRDLLRENQMLADQIRVQQRIISVHEAELKRLEREEPGITRVNWGPDGSVLIEESVD